MSATHENLHGESRQSTMNAILLYAFVPRPRPYLDAHHPLSRLAYSFGKVQYAVGHTVDKAAKVLVNACFRMGTGKTGEREV